MSIVQSALLGSSALTPPAIRIRAYRKAFGSSPSSELDREKPAPNHATNDGRELGGPADKIVWKAIRSVALAPQTEKLATFQAAARTLFSEARNGRLPHAEASDRLHQAAEAYGLIAEHGIDPVQKTLSNAIADIEAGTGSQFNGQTSELVDNMKAERSHASLHDNAEIIQLAKLDKLEYEHERKSAAKRLDVRASALDRLVACERQKSEDGCKQGRPLELPEPEPWPESVNGASLLDTLSSAIRQHVVMSDHAADTTALWALHSFLLDCFAISPRLAITSPEKGCGKTTLLDVLYHLVTRPLPTANASSSAIFRIVEMRRPTLLIDEADTFLSENEELRGILNSGHRHGGSVMRTVGEDFEPRAFSTYSACAIALIGKLPGTLADRSVPIEMRRRRADETIEPFRFDRTTRLDRLSRQAARWTADSADSIRRVDPAMPAGVFNRAADNWRPLLAIADVAGGDWPTRARRAIQCIGAGATADNQSIRTLLLGDIRTIFSERSVDRLSSAELVASLIEIEGRPWIEWRAGKPLSPNGLARLLAPFGITPATIRTSAGTPKGYQHAQFEDAFARYLPGGP